MNVSQTLKLWLHIQQQELSVKRKYFTRLLKMYVKALISGIRQHLIFTKCLGFFGITLIKLMKSIAMIARNLQQNIDMAFQEKSYKMFSF